MLGQAPFRVADYDYQLPPELIARYPLPERTQSRLLRLMRGTHQKFDHQFNELTRFLQRGDVLIFNDTRVIPARLFGHKASSGKVELLIERILNNTDAYALIKSSHAPKVGSEILLADGVRLRVLARKKEFYLISALDGISLLSILEQQGHVPIPPYFERADEALDQERYQTVYSRHPGAVAAPTAGLHFDDALLAQLQTMGVEFGYVTLHVGAGTFAPIRVDDLREHQMHHEVIDVPAATCALIATAKQEGRRVIAVGTTAVRSLETAAASGQLSPYQGDTNIFIYPGFTFKVIDGLITNFHLPKSTLLMLVCAFAGYEEMMASYTHAIQERYRFFSYGDAMLIL